MEDSEKSEKHTLIRIYGSSFFVARAIFEFFDLLRIREHLHVSTSQHIEKHLIKGKQNTLRYKV